MKHTQGWTTVVRLVCVAPLAALLVAGFAASADAATVKAPGVSLSSSTGGITGPIGDAVKDAVGVKLPSTVVDTPSKPSTGGNLPSKPSTGVDIPKTPTTGVDIPKNPTSGVGAGTGSGGGVGVGVGAGVGAGHGTGSRPGTDNPQPSSGASAGATASTAGGSRASTSGGRSSTGTKARTTRKHVAGTVAQWGLTAGDSSDGDENTVGGGGGAVQSGEISAQLMSAANTFGLTNIAILIGLTLLWAAWQVFRLHRESTRRRNAGNANASFIAALPEADREPSFSELIAR